MVAITIFLLKNFFYCNVAIKQQSHYHVEFNFDRTYKKHFYNSVAIPYCK